MHRFVCNTLRQLLDGTYWALLAAYILLCWLVAEVAYSQGGSPSCEQIVLIYQSVLLSMVLLNCMYFVMVNFRENLNGAPRDVLLIRLGREKYFWGLVTAYLFYYVVFFVIPLYMASAFQQYIHGAGSIPLQDYIKGMIDIVSGVALPSVILAIALIVLVKNDLIALIVWAIVYGILAFVQVMLSMYQSSSHAAGGLGINIISPLLINAVAITCGIFLGKKLTRFRYDEKISGGVFSYIAGRFGLDMSKNHYRMIGLKTQTLYLLFALFGFIFLLAMLRSANASTVVAAKIFSAVLVPVLFSFNQYSIVRIDKESNMLPVVFLRQSGYRWILLNRWLCMLLPQLIVAALFLGLLQAMYPEIKADFILFAVLLNIALSSTNFLLSLAFKSSGYANIIGGGIAYLMLREDVQNFFSQSPALASLNIFSSITAFDTHSPSLIHIGLILGLIVVNMLLIVKNLNRLNREATRNV